MPDLPNSSLHVLVTRAVHQGSAFADELRARGMKPVIIPAIEICKPESFAELDSAMAQLESFDWIIFTSANAVQVFAERRAGKPIIAKIAAIGAATARALEKAGMRVDLVPPQAVAESLASALVSFAQTNGRATRFLLVRAETARDVLPEVLRGAGAEVVIAPAYRNVVPQESIAAIRELFAREDVDVVAFTSSSSVTNLLELLTTAGVRMPQNVRFVSIGPITSATLRANGMTLHAEAQEATVASLAEACARL